MMKLRELKAEIDAWIGLGYGYASVVIDHPTEDRYLQPGGLTRDTSGIRQSQIPAIGERFTGTAEDLPLIAVRVKGGE